MEIKINIKKKHLYIFSAIIGVLIGVLIVNAYNSGGTGGSPVLFGHSVDEIEWSQVIPFLKWSNSRLRPEEGGSIELGGDDTISGTGNPYIDFHFNGLTENYNMRVTNNANARLDIRNSSGEGDLLVYGKVYNRNDCRRILNQPNAGSQSGIVDVPNECIDNECLIAIVDGANLLVRHYRQGRYDISASFDKRFWEGSSLKGYGSGLTFNPGDDSFAENGDIADKILEWTWGSGRVTLDDDGPSDSTYNRWSWSSQNNGFSLYVCR